MVPEVKSPQAPRPADRQRPRTAHHPPEAPSPASSPPPAEHGPHDPADDPALAAGIQQLQLSPAHHQDLPADHNHLDSVDPSVPQLLGAMPPPPAQLAAQIPAPHPSFFTPPHMMVPMQLAMQHHQQVPAHLHPAMPTGIPLPVPPQHPLHPLHHHAQMSRQPNNSAAPLPHPQVYGRFRLEASVWVGDLDPYMDENFLRSAVNMMGWGEDIHRIKVVRDRQRGMHAGYGFFEAASPEHARKLIDAAKGAAIPGSNRWWRLNMGRPPSHSAGSLAPANTQSTTSEMNPRTRPSASPYQSQYNSHSRRFQDVHVGDLNPSITEDAIIEALKEHFQSPRTVRIVCDSTGRSKGYAFVRFADPTEAQYAVETLGSIEIDGQPIRLNYAIGSRGTAPRPLSMTDQPKRPRQPCHKNDPNNSTVFIGGTDASINEDILYHELSHFGEVDAVKVPPNKHGFVFVRFKHRANAQAAIEAISGTVVEALNSTRAVRLEWASEQLPRLGSRPNGTPVHGAITPHQMSPVSAPPLAPMYDQYMAALYQSRMMNMYGSNGGAPVQMAAYYTTGGMPATGFEHDPSLEGAQHQAFHGAESDVTVE